MTSLLAEVQPDAAEAQDAILGELLGTGGIERAPPDAACGRTMYIWNATTRCVDVRRLGTDGQAVVDMPDAPSGDITEHPHRAPSDAAGGSYQQQLCVQLRW
jgi:hypothetical protein